MPPLNALDTWTIRENRTLEEPKAKCFLVGEGANTEFWYLDALATRLAKEGKPELIELKPVERTGDERNQSHPQKLLQHAWSIRNDLDGKNGFDPDTDRIVVFFDGDIYKNDPAKYSEIYRKLSEVAEVAVTYPSFELFLLLHKDNAYADLILPNADEILENDYAENSRRRFVEKLACDALGMNAKHNHAVGKLAVKFELAAAAESCLNQDPTQAIGRLTSNVALTIQRIIDEGKQNRTRCALTPCWC